MSKYDKDDGYEECSKCGELTRNIDQVCNICNGTVIPNLSHLKRRYKGPLPRTNNYQSGKRRTKNTDV